MSNAYNEEGDKDSAVALELKTGDTGSDIRHHTQTASTPNDDLEVETRLFRILKHL